MKGQSDCWMDSREAVFSRIRAADRDLAAFSTIFDNEKAGERAVCQWPEGSLSSSLTLQGVTVAIKDNMDVAGYSTRGGSLTTPQEPCSVSAAVVDTLRSQAALIVGKTHCVEFSIGGWGTNYHLGTPWNPWCTQEHRLPGGSSSGAAVAVAARMVSHGLGTDSGGSVRIPASWCGLTGLKTTAGRFDTRGVMPLSPSLDTIGVMAPSVADVRRLFSALAMQPPGGGGQSAALVSQEVAEPETIVSKVYRLATIPARYRTLVDPEVLKNLDLAILALTASGCELVEADLPCSLEQASELNSLVMAFEGYHLWSGVVDDHHSLMDPNVRHRLFQGRQVSKAQYECALQQRRSLGSDVAHFFQKVDALIMPTTMTVAPVLGQHDEHQLPAPSYFTRFANFLDLCALALPTGRCEATGMPTSFQLVGAPWAERKLLDIGLRYQKATRWHQLEPLIVAAPTARA